MTGIYRTIGPTGFGTYEVDLPQQRFTRVADDDSAPLLAPGFVDIHIHGAFGIDFMTADKDRQTELAVKLESIGYDYALFTTVTAGLPDVKRALDNLPEHPLVAGFHLEGPFLSRDYPGAQPAGFILDAEGNAEAWCSIWHHDKLRLVTLAPEIPGGFDLVERLFNRKVAVSIGHSNATFEECVQAADRGVRHTTHTYNAMRPLHHREAGVVGFALTDPRIACELIYDRVHVSPPAAKVLVQAKPQRLVAVSDSTMASGLQPGTELFMWGLECVVGDGDVRLKSGTLAGSAITLADAFKNLAEDFGPEVAIHACCMAPRAVIGMPPVRQYLVFDSNFRVTERHPV